jgi:hypothetical protein
MKLYGYLQDSPLSLARHGVLERAAVVAERMLADADRALSWETIYGAVTETLFEKGGPRDLLERVWPAPISVENESIISDRGVVLPVLDGDIGREDIIGLLEWPEVASEIARSGRRAGWFVSQFPRASYETAEATDAEINEFIRPPTSQTLAWAASATPRAFGKFEVHYCLRRGASVERVEPAIDDSVQFDRRRKELMEKSRFTNTIQLLSETATACSVYLLSADVFATFRSVVPIKAKFPSVISRETIVDIVRRFSWWLETTVPRLDLNETEQGWCFERDLPLGELLSELREGHLVYVFEAAQ